jgi:hypothetical protein
MAPATVGCWFAKVGSVHERAFRSKEPKWLKMPHARVEQVYLVTAPWREHSSNICAISVTTTRTITIASQPFTTMAVASWMWSG